MPTKLVVKHRQNSIRPCRAHAVLSMRYNYYLCTFLQCKLCIYKLFCEVISVSLHMSVITQYGDSALIKAVREGRTEVVSLLLEAGANVHLQNKVHVGVHVQVVWEEI